MALWSKQGDSEGWAGGLAPSVLTSVCGMSCPLGALVGNREALNQWHPLHFSYTELDKAHYVFMDFSVPVDEIQNC